MQGISLWLQQNNVALWNKDEPNSSTLEAKMENSMATTTFTLVLWDTRRKVTHTLQNTSVLNVRNLASLTVYDTLLMMLFIYFKPSHTDFPWEGIS